MNDKHPITPPLELVHQWADMLSSRSDHAVFSFAAQWGADQELETCCTWLSDHGYIAADPDLRAARRPKPPSLKEQALTALLHLLSGSAQTLDTTEAEFYIRRALEELPE
jgi:hypothetical protein